MRGWDTKNRLIRLRQADQLFKLRILDSWWARRASGLAARLEKNYRPQEEEQDSQ